MSIKRPRGSLLPTVTALPEDYARLVPAFVHVRTGGADESDCKSGIRPSVIVSDRVKR